MAWRDELLAALLAHHIHIREQACREGELRARAAEGLRRALRHALVIQPVPLLDVRVVRSFACLPEGARFRRRAVQYTTLPLGSQLGGRIACQGAGVMCPCFVANVSLRPGSRCVTVRANEI